MATKVMKIGLSNSDKATMKTQVHDEAAHHLLMQSVIIVVIMEIFINVQEQLLVLGIQQNGQLKH